MNCGAVANGCGGLVNCAGDDGGEPCPSGETCGGGGQPNTCGASDLLPDGGFFDAGGCTPIPQTTACASINCGVASDGCGGGYNCGTCTAPQTCGGGGTPSVCGGNSGCVPTTACPSGENCGVVANGCGGLVTCGTDDGGGCASGETCGGGGSPNTCGAKNILPDGAVVDGGLNVCTPIPQSTACAGLNCGLASDGCGDTYNCGTCTAPQTCGGGGTPSVCGGNSGCVPLTVCPSGMNCGIVANGCGGTVTCGVDGGTCPTGELCGGGGSPNVCGAKNILPDGGIVDGGLNVCTPIPQSTACAGIGCGQTGDGCGNLYTCGTCTAPESCGGGGTPFQCGQAACTPLTTCPAGIQCGTAANGCGGTINCGTCTAPATCGGGGTPYQCGEPACVPATTCPANVTCGPAADGCGGEIASCGTCTAPATCGGGGVASQCGTPPCVPLTTCPAPANCGTWPNGCGTGSITCGANGGNCTYPEICGGSGVPSVCGGGLPDGGVACDAGLLCDLSECDGGSPTVLKGKIFDPAGLNPLYNVVVYVPNTTPSALPHGQPSCQTCSSLYTGDPIVSTTTDTDGNFVLSGVPVPANGQVPIVIQVGWWRREWVWPGVTACTTNTATASDETYLRLPGLESTATPSPTTTNDDLPQIGISTGEADSMECLFKRIGFAATPGGNDEYVCGWNGGVGHLHIFQGGDATDGQGGYTTSGCTERSAAAGGLWDVDSDLYKYDILILSCEGAETYSPQTQVLHDFATVGGRAFASHFHYKWFNQAPYSAENLGTWVTTSNPVYDNAAGTVNQLNADIVETLPDGGTPLKTWLGNVGALGTNGAPAGELYINSPRYNVQVTASNTPSQVWIVPDNSTYYYENAADKIVGLPANTAQYFSFNTPTGGTGDAGAPYCGRIVYSDLHVGSAAGDYTTALGHVVPTGCASGALSPQEKALEYMILNLASCVGSDTNLPSGPSCTPLTTCPAGYTCGSYPNGCGTGNITCGTCSGTASCVDGQCVSCVPQTTCPAGVTCGEYPDGCGGIIACGTCSSGSCINGTCQTGCVPQTCASQHIACGLAGDGCGNILPLCGTCAAGQSCIDGACVTAPCNTVSCATLGLSCGPAGNGCGGTQNCGTCTVTGQTCGGGGTPGVCGEGDANLCVPLTCAGQGIECGPAGDGCGNLIASCGSCPTGQTCGGGGTPGVCGAPNCTPTGCGSLQCGDTGNGCGGVISCGTCTPPETCGGGGTNGVCGLGDANACVPLGCGSLTCGQTGDGCGNIITCGTCTPPQTCGGGGVPGACGAPTCTPLGCGSLTCGPSGNGCGGTLNCGTCTPPETCGGGGTPGVCGQSDAIACTPLTCGTLQCGETGDGCGNLLNCGTCTPPQTCGGGGVAGECGAPTCTPATCASLGVTCGQVADGCGGLTANCGTCTAPATCGGGGTANQCGSPNCTPMTCTQAGANCGPVADGCGGIIQCGTCTAPDTCGGGGVTSVCGTGGVK